MIQLVRCLALSITALVCAQADAQNFYASVSVRQPDGSFSTSVDPATASATNNVSGVGASFGTSSLIGGAMSATAWASQTNVVLFDSYIFGNVAAPDTYAELHWSITTGFTTPAVQPDDLVLLTINMDGSSGERVASAATDCSLAMQLGYPCTTGNLVETGTLPISISNGSHRFYTYAILRGGDNGRTDFSINYWLTLPDGVTVTTLSGQSMPIMTLVPEPAGVSLMLIGLPLLVMRQRRSRRTRQPGGAPGRLGICC